MSTFTITAADFKNLKKRISSAINDEEDIGDVIDEWKNTLKTAKARKTKKPVDKEMEKAIGKAPKRGKTAYIIFGEQNRATFKKENPDASFGELTQLISAAWNEIKDDKKKSKKYHDLAAKDKLRADKEKKVYEQKLKSYKSGEEVSESDVESSEEKPKKGKKPVKKAKEESDVEEEASEEKPKKGAKKTAPKKGKAKEESEEEEEKKDLQKMKLPELKALAKERGVDIKGKTKKDDIIAALETAEDKDESATEKEEEEEEEEVEDEE